MDILKDQFDAVYGFARETLSAERFSHSLRVAEEASRLGRAAGEDTRRCMLAGILHDICREYTAEQYSSLGFTEVPFCCDPANGKFDRALMHGMAAAETGRRRFGITDERVLEAVSWHTTGKPGMCRLAAVIFVADYTEPGREGEFFDRVRRAAECFGLAAAVREEARLTLEHLLEKRGLGPDTAPEEIPADIRRSYDTYKWADENGISAFSANASE